MSIFLALLGLGIAVIVSIRNARAERVSKLVFLFSAVHVFFVFPKVLALAVSNGPAADYFRASGITFTATYMALICYLATIFSYTLMAPKRVFYGIEKKAIYRLMSRFSMAVGGLGICAFLALVINNGGLSGYFLELNFYQMELTGATVWFIFLSRFVYPAIAAMALIVAYRPSRWALYLLALFSFFPLMNVILLFRRSDLLFVGFIGLYALSVSGRIKLSRGRAMALLVAMAFLITMFPYFRQDSISAATGREYKVADMTVQERIADAFEVDVDDEVVRAASSIDNAHRTGNYQFGAFVWDSLVSQFVPSTLLGEGVKNSLYLGRGSNSDQGYFDQESFFYVAPMGFAQAYEQFGPLGWIIFAAFGALIARIERKSSKVSNQIFLMIAIPTVCLASSNDITSIPARLLTFWILTRFLGKAKLEVLQSSRPINNGVPNARTPLNM